MPVSVRSLLFVVACSSAACSGTHDLVGGTDGTTGPDTAADTAPEPGPDTSDPGVEPGVLCGDGVVGPGEECDDGEGNSDEDPDACRLDCLTARCGDGVRDSGEECDGRDVGDATCESLDIGRPSGHLRCFDDCSFDTHMCEPECGNGRRDAGEQCDGLDLAGETCESLGRDGGVLACGTDCRWDERGCLSHPACVRYVDASADPGGDGSSWESAYASLHDAIAGSPTDCELWLAQGSYHAWVTGPEDGFLFDVSKKVFGGFAGDEAFRRERDPAARPTFLEGEDPAGSGDAVYHVVSTVADVVLDGLVIRGGSATGPGTNQDEGGGVFNRRSAPVIIGCILADNAAIKGGGLWSGSGSAPVLLDTIIEGNTAEVGAGAFLDDADVSISGCDFRGNEAGRGGGLYVEDCSPMIAGSWFVANVAEKGAGAYLRSYATAHFTNCVFRDNEASTGGGIYADQYSIVYVGSSTIAFGAGYDVYLTASSNATVVNSILWGTTPPGLNTGDTAQVDWSDVEGGFEGDGNISADPLFADPETGDLSLLPGSPCIDAANGSLAPPEDVLDTPRWDDPDTPDTGRGAEPWVDMGAYEYHP